MALTYSPAGELGSRALDFALLGTDGVTHRLNDFRNEKVLVVVFMCNHCPYVQAVQGRINALVEEYRDRGVAVVGINPNDSKKYPDDGFEAMKERVKEEGFVFHYLWDETQEVARAYGAVCTPDFFVYKNQTRSKEVEFALKYRGQLDDNWKDAGAVKRRDLALALDAILSGREPSPDQKPAMGCSIKWK